MKGILASHLDGTTVTLMAKDTMSRQTDLEQSIRESYRLIPEYEDMIRLSDRPKEKLGAKRGLSLASHDLR